MFFNISPYKYKYISVFINRHLFCNKVLQMLCFLHRKLSSLVKVFKTEDLMYL